jgi:hypothetical protein
MPTLRNDTLRAWLFLHFGEEGEDGPDYPANELLYRSELVPAAAVFRANPNEPEYLRFNLYRTVDGVEQRITYLTYPVGGRAHGTVERQFMEDVAAQVGRTYEERKARFLKAQELVQAAGFPV